MTREGWNPERPIVGWGRGDNEGIQGCKLGCEDRMKSRGEGWWWCSKCSRPGIMDDVKAALFGTKNIHDFSIF